MGSKSSKPVQQEHAREAAAYRSIQDVDANQEEVQHISRSETEAEAVDGLRKGPQLEDVLAEAGQVIPASRLPEEIISKATTDLPLDIEMIVQSGLHVDDTTAAGGENEALRREGSSSKTAALDHINDAVESRQSVQDAVRELKSKFDINAPFLEQSSDGKGKARDDTSDLAAVRQEMDAYGVSHASYSGTEAVSQSQKQRSASISSGDSSDSESSGSESDASSSSSGSSLGLKPRRGVKRKAGRQDTNDVNQVGGDDGSDGDDNDDDDDDDAEEGRRGKKMTQAEAAALFATPHEILDPQIPAPKVQRLPPDARLEVLGQIDSIIDTVIVIRSGASQAARGPSTSGNSSNPQVQHANQILDEGSLVCTSTGDVIGPIFEVFGAITNPLYSIRLTSGSPFLSSLTAGDKVYFSTNADYATLLYTRDIQLSQVKASDASNLYDEEPGEGEVEFSDDEAEQEYKRALKAERKRRRIDNSNYMGGAGSSYGDLATYQDPDGEFAFDEDFDPENEENGDEGDNDTVNSSQDVSNTEARSLQKASTVKAEDGEECEIDLGSEAGSIFRSPKATSSSHLGEHPSGSSSRGGGRGDRGRGASRGRGGRGAPQDSSRGGRGGGGRGRQDRNGDIRHDSRQQSRDPHRDGGRGGRGGRGRGGNQNERGRGGSGPAGYGRGSSRDDRQYLGGRTAQYGGRPDYTQDFQQPPARHALPPRPAFAHPDALPYDAPPLAAAAAPTNSQSAPSHPSAPALAAGQPKMADPTPFPQTGAGSPQPQPQSSARHQTPSQSPFTPSRSLNNGHTAGPVPPQMQMSAGAPLPHQQPGLGMLGNGPMAHHHQHAPLNFNQHNNNGGGRPLGHTPMNADAGYDPSRPSPSVNPYALLQNNPFLQGGQQPLDALRAMMQGGGGMTPVGLPPRPVSGGPSPSMLAPQSQMPHHGGPPNPNGYRQNQASPRNAAWTRPSNNFTPGGGTPGPIRFNNNGPHAIRPHYHQTPYSRPMHKTFSSSGTGGASGAASASSPGSAASSTPLPPQSAAAGGGGGGGPAPASTRNKKWVNPNAATSKAPAAASSSNSVENSSAAASGSP